MTVAEENNTNQHRTAKNGEMTLRPVPFTRKPDGQAMYSNGAWTEASMPSNGIEPSHNHTGSHVKLSQHRRGMSLDETRVQQSGLVGVGPTGDSSNSSTSNQSHRRVVSQGVYYPSNTNRHPQQHPYHQLYTGGPIAQLAASTNPNKTPLPEVKFVNSTVEALEDQIRKEDAPKKKRTRTTPEQLRILQKAFNADPMPNSSTRVALAKKLGMNARAVQVWFQNRRAKAKLETRRGGDSGRNSSGTDSPYPGNMDDYDDGNEMIDYDDDLDQPDPAAMNSYRTTNRTLKATGMMGRMAFPPDLEYFNGYNPPTISYQQQPYPQTTHHNLHYPPQKHHSAMSRSYSLPYLESNYHHHQMDMMSGLCDSVMDNEDMLSGNSTVLSRSDSAQFAPYEFAAGSRNVLEFVTQSDDGDRTNSLSRCQSLPIDSFEDTAAGLVDLLPPIDDPVWPSIVDQPDSYANTYNMRRSFSLPNVYYYENDDINSVANQQPKYLADPEIIHSSRSTSPSDTNMEYATIPHQHRRSRSHSISHNPDYPENLNDFLTAGTTSYDD